MNTAIARTRGETARRDIDCVDLFCGSGGTSTGLFQAADTLGVSVRLVAVNHWRTAIETHTANHPGVVHHCEDLETVNPRHAVPGGHLHLLVASPECTHHSNARGGRPMSDQSRASAWHVLRWAEALHIDHILIENVREFREWGPLHGCTCGLGDGADVAGPHTKACKRGRPIEAMKGRLYRQFLASLRALGYRVEERVLNAADFGDATTRQRLFIQARRGTKRPVWPAPTHLKPCEDPLGLLAEYPKWRPAREIIDWSLPSKSIYARKRPLAPATMARIFAGLYKYSGLPFIVPQFSSQGPRDIERPVGTITTQSRGVGLCEPFLIPNFGEAHGQHPRTHSVGNPLPTVTSHGAGCLVEPFLIGAGGPTGAGEPRSVERPLGTILTENNRGLVQPFLVILRNNADVRSVEDPAPTVTAGGNHLGLAEPYIVPNRTNGTAHSLDEPLRTLTTGDNMILCQPFVIGQQSCAAARETGRPLPTIATAGAISLVEPFLVPTTHGGGPERTHDIGLPLPTVTTAHRGELAVCEPFLSKFHGSHAGKSDGARRNLSLDDPMPTLDTSNRVGLAQPFLVSYYGHGQAASLDEPLDTITARDRFALVDPRLVTEGMVEKGEIVGWLDVRFRMLQPHELAGAMSFPGDYWFAGNREAQVKQIGNSVAVGTARALCTEILREYAPSPGGTDTWR